MPVYPDLSHPENAELVDALREHRVPPPHRLKYRMRPSTASHVHGNLWMGGWPPPAWEVGRHFDCLVLCAREYQVPECFSGVQVALAVLDDDGSPMTREEQGEAVRAAGRVIRWLGQDLRVLVTCFAGLNRSGLVCSIALCRGPAGASPGQAVRAVRKARGPRAMSNPHFQRFLSAFCGPRGRGS